MTRTQTLPGVAQAVAGGASPGPAVPSGEPPSRTCGAPWGAAATHLPSPGPAFRRRSVLGSPGLAGGGEGAVPTSWLPGAPQKTHSHKQRLRSQKIKKFLTDVTLL